MCGARLQKCGAFGDCAEPKCAASPIRGHGWTRPIGVKSAFSCREIAPIGPNKPELPRNSPDESSGSLMTSPIVSRDRAPSGQAKDPQGGPHVRSQTQEVGSSPVPWAKVTTRFSRYLPSAFPANHPESPDSYLSQGAQIQIQGTRWRNSGRSSQNASGGHATASRLRMSQ
jgi:hypothetical protein